MTVISFLEARAARGLPLHAGTPEPIPFAKGERVMDRCSGRRGRVSEDADATGLVEVFFFPTDRCPSLRLRRHPSQLARDAAAIFPS